MSRRTITIYGQILLSEASLKRMTKAELIEYALGLQDSYRISEECRELGAREVEKLLNERKPMSNFISREKLIDYLYENNVHADISIEDLADEIIAKPKVGQWIEEYNGNGWNDYWDYTCSVCGKKYERADVLCKANYCPNCGAKMRAE